MSRPSHMTSTTTGQWIDVLRLHPSEVSLEDIARGLGYTCRWAGMFPFFYSVAEHSIYVASVLSDAGCGVLAQAGRLHDAAEAYMGDVPAPHKKLLRFDHGEGDSASFADVETRMLRVIFGVLDCPWPDEDEWETIYAADAVVLDCEQALRETWATRHGYPVPQLHDEGYAVVDAAYELLGVPREAVTLRGWHPDRARTQWLSAVRRRVDGGR